MTEQRQHPVELPIGAIANGHLTTEAYTSVFAAMLTAMPRIHLEGRVRINLDHLKWIDHLPLLSVTMLVQQCARFCADGCEVVLPADPTREAFLERWGFFRLLNELEADYEVLADRKSYDEAEYSRVLAITSFSNMSGAGVARDQLLKAEGHLLDVLHRQACLQDADVAALAELVVFELCKNVVEHSKSQIGGSVIAHASKPSAQMAEVRNRLASPWEKQFLAQIGEEGVTEIVVGDAGIGIVETLRAKAMKRGAVIRS